MEKRKTSFVEIEADEIVERTRKKVGNGRGGWNIECEISDN